MKLGRLTIEPLDWLLLAMPVAMVLRWVVHPSDVWIFLVSCIAVIPLAGLMGRATENLAETLGPGIGGLLNATFGNAAELIIALAALSKGPQMYPLVKASITGSIIGNVLLVMGLSMFAGGIKHKRQTFNRTAAGMGTTLLALSSIGLIIPTVYFYLLHLNVPGGPAATINEGGLTGSLKLTHLSEEIAAILAVTYVLSLVFSLKTHQHLFAGEEHEKAADDEPQQYPQWSRKTSILVLLAATAGIAVMSEFLVGSVEHAAASMGMNEIFVGVIVVAVIGNAAEHSTAVMVAMKNKMDLAVNVAVGSSIQVALFVAPVLVFATLLMGHGQVMDLHFSLLEVIAVVLSMMILSMVSQDGESHWMEGVMLLAVYVMLALAFYHLPHEAG